MILELIFAVATAMEPVCDADQDLGGLFEALEKTGLEVAMDAAEVIHAYQGQRMALCARLMAKDEELQAVRDSREALQKILSVTQQDRDLLRKEWEAALLKSAPHKPLLACGPGGSIGVGPDGSFYGVSVSCVLPMWP